MQKGCWSKLQSIPKTTTVVVKMSILVSQVWEPGLIGLMGRGGTTALLRSLGSVGQNRRGNLIPQQPCMG